jgi:hypothetical protein
MGNAESRAQLIGHHAARGVVAPVRPLLKLAIPQGALITACLVASVGARFPQCQAAPEEIQVYVDDMTAPGHFGADVHNNYVFSGSDVATYAGEQPPDHVYRLTPEFYYGLSNTIELGLYVLSTHTASGDSDLDGAKVRIKFIAPHDPSNGRFWGANLEIGDTSRRVAETPWNGELKGILGYRTGPWLLAINPNVDWSLSAHGGPATVDVDFKIAYSVGSKTQIGVESYNDLGPLNSLQPLSQNSKTFYLAVDQDFGKFDLNAGLGRGLTGDSDRWIFKFIVGSRF